MLCQFVYEQVLLKIEKFGYLFSKIIPEIISCRLVPMRNAVLARVKKEIEPAPNCHDTHISLMECGDKYYSRF